VKHKYRNLFIFSILLFFTINLIPIALGKTRQSYLKSYIYSNEFEGKGFADAKNKTISIEATAYALEILDRLDADPHKSDDLQINLEDEIKKMIDENKVDLYNLYYLMKSLTILDPNYVIETEYFNKIYKFVNDTEQLSGGFSYSNSSTTASMTSTHYVVQIYILLDKPIVNETLHKNWVLLCNNSDGGYGGDRNLSSSLINTYFAIRILDGIEQASITDLADINMTLTYLKSFYIDEVADVNNYGGYIPDEFALYALLSSTYFSVKAISMLDGELNSDDTINWVLERQNFQDGGFAENTEGYDQKVSSVIASYYAFEILNILNSLFRLTSEVWMVEFNYWTLGIILMSIGIVAAAIVFIWRRRRI
jgi:hypothetical protein